MSSIFRRIFGTNKKNKLFFNTDIHSHICPGIDDGSRNLANSVEMVGKMYNLGIKRMFVTPHVADETFPNTHKTIADSFAILQKGVRDADIPMLLDYSAEYRIGELTLEMLQNGTAKALPGNHILIENPWLQEPYRLDEFLYNLQTKYDLKPILAHPERYPYYQANPQKYKYLHDRGVLFQINLLSLAGYYDRNCRRTAEALLESGLTDFVGSDIHRPEHIDIISKYIHSSAYLKLIAKADKIRNDRL